MKLTKLKLKQLIHEELNEIDIPWEGAQEDPLHRLRQDALARLDTITENVEKLQALHRNQSLDDMQFENLIMFLQEWREDLTDQ